MTVTVNQAFDRHASFIRSVPDIFPREGELIYSGRNKVKRFTMPDGTRLVVKSYKRPWLLQRFIYTFIRKSKARRAYEYAGMLDRLGFRTPAGAAYIEIKKGGLVSDTYFISANTDLPSVREVLDRSDKETAGKLIKSVARYMANLHSKGVIHGDPNLSNILVDTSGTDYEFELIDTNRSKFVDKLSHKQIVHNLMRVTHVRDLSHTLSREYAETAGLDPSQLENDVEQALCRFENNRRIRHKLLFKS